MPNIEIFGFCQQDAIEMSKTIFTLLRDNLPPPLVKEAVVTVHPSNVLDQHGKAQPFLRLCTTEGDETGSIIRLLKLVGLDIEVIKLHAFIPKTP